MDYQGVIQQLVSECNMTEEEAVRFLNTMAEEEGWVVI